MSRYNRAGEETWRIVEVNTHKLGSLGPLIGKRVYQYSTRATTTPSSTNDYTYTYDAVGNVQVIYRASGTVGQEAYFFAQDAFGNELSGDTATPASNRTNLLGGASWTTARTAGITEHQTGKIQSSFTGLVYFCARWYDPVVGRFICRDRKPSIGGSIYGFCNSNPLLSPDPTGKCPGCAPPVITDPNPEPTFPNPFKPMLPPPPTAGQCPLPPNTLIGSSGPLSTFNNSEGCCKWVTPSCRKCVIKEALKAYIPFAGAICEGPPGNITDLLDFGDIYGLLHKLKLCGEIAGDIATAVSPVGRVIDAVSFVAGVRDNCGDACWLKDFSEYDFEWRMYLRELEYRTW